MTRPYASAPFGAWIRVFITRRLMLAVVLAGALTACQMNEPIGMATETEETLPVSVTPSTTATPDLEGQTVSGTIVVSIATEGWMKDVRFFVDGAMVFKVKTPPFELAIDTTKLSDGSHTVGIEARMPTGQVRVSQLVEFFVNNSTPPGAEEPSPSEPEPTPEEPAQPVPAGMIEIPLGSHIQAIIDQHPNGTEFFLRAGVHRHQSFSLSSGDTLEGEEGAILSGARLLTDFKRDGSLWYAPNQAQYGGPANRYVYGNMDICIDNHTGAESPRCNYPEDLFIDDVMLRHVATKSDVQPGSWYFDYDADRIYFADDPTGRRVETSVTSSGISANGATNVTLRNLVVEKYAVPAQSAAVQTGTGWTIEDSVFRFNHGIGIRLKEGATMRTSRSHHNGQLGVGALGDRIVIEDSRIDHNNAAGYATGWAGGGTKFLYTTNMRVSRTHVHDNDGPGLWFDYDNVGSISEDNVLTNNTGPGFLAEASFDLTIRNNLVEGNGFGRTSWLLGAGILVNSSNGVTVTGNTVRYNYHGITLIQAKTSHELKDVYVSGNIVEMVQGKTGMVVMGSLSNPDYYFNNNIRFANNQYSLGGQSNPFSWEAENLTFSGWQAAGMDADGSVSSTTVLASAD